jgi:hypothetical protein
LSGVAKETRLESKTFPIDGQRISRPQIELLGVAPHDSWSTAAAIACTLEWETPEIAMNRCAPNWHTYCSKYYAIVFS